MSTTATTQGQSNIAEVAEALAASGLTEEALLGPGQLDQLLIGWRFTFHRDPIGFDHALATGRRAGGAYLAELLPSASHQAARATRLVGSAPAATRRPDVRGALK